ncbi:MAG: ComEA family DNA-binding protein [Pyrinomonadaceae bacterium]
MQSLIQKNKHNHFNIYRPLVKLLLLIICCFLFGCDKQIEPQQVSSTKNQYQVSESAININTASAEELERLPRVGAKTAQNIIRHREKYGKFRKPEHLMFVQGISDRHFREIRSLIKVK